MPKTIKRARLRSSTTNWRTCICKTNNALVHMPTVTTLDLKLNVYNTGNISKKFQVWNLIILFVADWNINRHKLLLINPVNIQTWLCSHKWPYCMCIYWAGGRGIVNGTKSNSWSDLLSSGYWNQGNSINIYREFGRLSTLQTKHAICLEIATKISSILASMLKPMGFKHFVYPYLFFNIIKATGIDDISSTLINTRGIETIVTTLNHKYFIYESHVLHCKVPLFCWYTLMISTMISLFLFPTWME